MSEALEPGTVVEFGILLLDQALVVDDHVVDTSDWERSRCSGRDLRGDLPSPCDILASVEDVQGVDLNLRLEDTLTIVESSLVGERDGAELTRSV